MENDKTVHERRFEAAVKVMRSLPEDGTFEPSDDMLAMFYSYYKQATVGPCNTTKPNAWDSIGEAKWEAWKALGDMTKEQAMKEYVQEIQLILETMPVTEEVAELLDELEPFYEVVDDEDDEVTSRPAILAIEAERSDEEEEEEGDEESGCFGEVEDGEDDVKLEDSSEDVNRSVVVKAERGSLLVCNGNAETHSISSLTSSTHSSLNTEEDEEELACSRENSLDSDLYTCADHITDDVSEPSQQSDDTVSDVYSDSVEHPADREGSGVSRVRLAASGAAEAKRPVESGGSQDGKQQETPLPNPAAAGPVQSERVSVSRGGVSGCSSAGSRLICDAVGTLSSQDVAQRVETSPVVDKCSVNTQIAAALSRLQDDMLSVLQRLNALETQTAAQVETFPPECDPHSASVKKRLHWWPLDASPIMVALALVWPFAVHWLVQLYLQKTRRRIK
ncbi:acyl-CoA-binding domain-containing protein 5-B [Colossoma macropomum]|uniref:acyl-CoA-binding domain-containing protein 5-B n=1 Tax=Colossoma macropomum TaxID=42526 RepID=UPI001864560B|nr:acyl-CoA-binding domain-containing protein 5-B [Colossoma macropomum]